MMITRIFPWIVLFTMILANGCVKNSEISETATPTPTPTAVPTSTPTPLPTVTPAPTPAPQGPAFRLIRLNREVMKPEQVEKYGRNLAGKKVAGWIGYFYKALPSEEAGLSRVVLDMDEAPNGMPDVILENIPNSIAESLQPRQCLNFSGALLGYVDIPDCRFQLSLGDVQIYGYSE
ncbi:MAG: hypothetical protein JXR73_18650 [Candidatus Omnitrophica bacterium]|nr:hypothetical protein [Candidatus Omnitrophota bacterium]